MLETDLLERSDLLACIEMGKALTAELDSDRLLGTVLERISALLPAQNWSLLLADPATGELTFELSVGLDPGILQDLRLKPGEGIAGQVALRKEPMIVPDVAQCAYFTPRVDRLSGLTTRSITCLPLVFAGRTVGVLEVINPRGFGHKEQALLAVAADYLAIAVENTQRYRRLQDIAHRDALTGLFNTRHLYEDLERLAEESRASGRPFSLVFLDLDNFKRVVDEHGHLNGSRALREVAEAIRRSLAGPEYGVSYGGDEFVAVLPGADRSVGLGKAEEIRTRIAETPYLTDQGLQVRITASLGVATFPADASEASALLALADQAMFEVKKGGKNAVHSLAGAIARRAP